VCSVPSETKLRNNFGQVVHTYVPLSVTKQYNLVLVEGRWRSSAGKVTAGLVESNGSLPPVDDLKSHLDWLPVHRDQLRAQRSVTSMGELYMFTIANLMFALESRYIWWLLDILKLIWSSSCNWWLSIILTLGIFPVSPQVVTWSSARVHQQQSCWSRWLTTRHWLCCVLQQTGTTSFPAPTVGLVTEHFLSLLLKLGTVYPQTSRSLPAQQTLSNDA